MEEIEQEEQTTENICVGKWKGIYFNVNRPDYNEEYFEKIKNDIIKINAKTLIYNHQSIHHINFYINERGTFDKVQILFRRAGIKPEDIDGVKLLHKEKEGTLTYYESILLQLWRIHYDKGILPINPKVERFMINIARLRRQMDKNYPQLENMSQEELKALEYDALEFIRSVDK